MTIRYLVTQLLRAHGTGQAADVDHILGLLVEATATPGPAIVATPETIVACAKCFDTEAQEYRLRRIMGRYVLLCFKNGDGCWEHSPRPTCSYKDHEGVQCQFPAEALVTYGADQTISESVCALHVGACLTPAHGKITVYPLEI